MCGITGMLDLRQQGRVERSVLERMIGVLLHRGPDGTTLHCTPDFGVAFCRLSIVDVAGGQQPFTNEDGRVISVCNGEIYNHDALRERLIGRGHRLRTRCDAEVLPHLYEEHGPELIEHLNGQFAFAVYDARARRLLAARDPFGIAPFFYCVVDDLLVFGSEIKALLCHPAVPRQVDPLGLDQVWSFTGTVSPRTMFRGVRSLPSGHLLLADTSGVQTRAYWDLEYPTAAEEAMVSVTEAEAVSELDAALDRAVARRLQGDVPITVTVSGGLDSALVAAKARRLKPDGIVDAFSVEFPDPELSEAAYQELVTSHLGLRRQAHAFRDAELGERLGRTVWHTECPIKELLDTAALALSESIRSRNYKVVLSGQGADELFAGYVGYRFDAFQAERARASSPAEAAIRRVLWGDDTFLYERDQAAFLSTKRSFFSPGLRETLGDLGCLSEPLVDAARIRDRHPVHRRSYVDVKLRLGDHLLADVGDRMSFGNSVETRYPFLDRDLVEVVRRYPASWKLNGYEDKYLLKKVAAPYLPRKIVRRDKRGFAAPGSPVLLRQRHAWVDDLLSPARLAREGFFDVNTVSALRLRYEQPDFRINAPFEDDLLALVITFGLFRETFGLPAL